MIDVLGNLPFKATENDLVDFLKLSPQTEVEIPVFRQKPHRKIGFAFVTIEPDCVEDVLKYDSEEMMGRRLKIALAKNQSKSERWQKRTPIKITVSGVCVKIYLVEKDNGLLFSQVL